MKNALRLSQRSFSSQNSILRPRSSYPLFKAKAATEGKIVGFDSQKLLQNYLVTVFYPYNFTFVCPTELIAFSDAFEDFKKLKANIIGISTDSVHSHLNWLRMPRSEGGVAGLKFPLISDSTHTISRQFGFLVEDEQDELFGASLRGLVISNDKGIVKHVQANDAPVGRSVEEALRLIEAFQSVDKNGEVCPANWKPGKATMVPDHAKKAEFFKKNY